MHKWIVKKGFKIGTLKTSNGMHGNTLQTLLPENVDKIILNYIGTLGNS